jgi:drug/metabolite transporter (DMT)-like permease
VKVKGAEVPAHPHAKHIDWWGIWLVLISAVGFSAKAIFVKLAYADTTVAIAPIDPVTLLALRMWLAAPGFLLLVWWTRRQAAASRADGAFPPALPLRRRDWLAVIGLGFIGYYAASLLDFQGLQYISAGLERLILFLNPTIVVLLSVLFAGYRIGRRDLLALVFSYAGIALVFVHDLSLSGNVLLGSALVLASAFGYLVGGGQMVQRIGSLRFGAYASLVSTVFITLHFLLFNKFAALNQPARVYALVALMALVSTVLPIVLMAEGMRRIGSSKAAMLSAIGPVMTIFLGYLFLAEPITLIQLAGAALVVGGVLIISLKKGGRTK